MVLLHLKSCDLRSCNWGRNFSAERRWSGWKAGGRWARRTAPALADNANAPGHHPLRFGHWEQSCTGAKSSRRCLQPGRSPKRVGAGGGWWGLVGLRQPSVSEFHWLLLRRFSSCTSSSLTQNDSQHLSCLLLPRVHAPEARVQGVGMVGRAQRCVRPPVRQVLHLATHPDGGLLAVALPPHLLLPLPVLLLLQVQLGAAAGGVADAAAVLRVHRGQDGVFHRSRLGAFAPQASWQQLGLGGTRQLYALLSGTKYRPLSQTKRGKSILKPSVFKFGLAWIDFLESTLDLCFSILFA